jgi:hypothetical protein
VDHSRHSLMTHVETVAVESVLVFVLMIVPTYVLILNVEHAQEDF